MDEKRLQVYFGIINQLIIDASDEKEEIALNAEPEYIDAGLVQTMLEVAQELSKEGNKDAAEFLIGSATQLAEALGLSLSDFTADNQGELLIQVLLVTEETEGNPEAVYPLLEKNIELIDNSFAEFLRNWAMDAISESTTEEAEDIAATIGIFSSLIHEFPSGKRINNLEIAIAGYEIASSVFTCASYPEQWAVTQYNLGNAYNDRICGEKAENIEKSISCYQAGLAIHTRETYPYEWAMIQNNLGTAYSNRIKEDKTENLNQAIYHYKAALQVHTHDEYPDAWQIAQNNLTEVYQEKSKKF